MMHYKYGLLFILFSLSAVVFGDIAVAGASSSSSISISSEDFENNKEYQLEINITGVDPGDVILERRGQMLVLDVRQGGKTKNIQAGSQSVFYTYSFNNDANMAKTSILYFGNTIKVIVPKL